MSLACLPAALLLCCAQCTADNLSLAQVCVAHHCQLRTVHNTRQQLSLCLLFFPESLVDFFGVIAADAAWVEGLTQLGSEAWCLNATDPHKLAEDLIYLSNAKALPIATLHGIQAAFARTHVRKALGFAFRKLAFV